MRKLLGSSLFIGAAAAGAIALSAPAAFAAGPWNVTNSNTDGSFTVALQSGTTVAFTDTQTTAGFTCTGSTIDGNAPAGTGLGNPIATITDGTFDGCTGPFFSTGTAHITGGDLNGVSYNSGTDVVTGSITNIHADLTIDSILGECTGTVEGSIGGTADIANGQDTYANGSGTLALNADPAPQSLAITSTAGSCAGLINTGDPVTFQATYVGTDPIPPITARQ